MTEMKMCLIDKNRLLSERRKSTYYHLPNGDTAIPIIDIEHAPTVDAVPREIEQANKQAAYVRGYEDGQKDKYGRWVDAVEVIRCKDCKSFSHGYCRFHDAKFVRLNGYCYWGEGKDGEA